MTRRIVSAEGAAGKSVGRDGKMSLRRAGLFRTGCMFARVRTWLREKSNQQWRFIRSIPVVYFASRTSPLTTLRAQRLQ